MSFQTCMTYFVETQTTIFYRLLVTKQYWFPFCGQQKHFLKHLVLRSIEEIKWWLMIFRLINPVRLGEKTAGFYMV